MQDTGVADHNPVDFPLTVMRVRPNVMYEGALAVAAHQYHRGRRSDVGGPDNPPRIQPLAFEGLDQEVAQPVVADFPEDRCRNAKPSEVDRRVRSAAAYLKRHVLHK